MKKATIEDMEIGNILFGNSRGTYKIDRQGGYEDIFAEFLTSNNFDSYGYKKDNKERTFENDVFIIRPYYWGDDEEEAQLPNFVHKATNLEINWYKYPMRDAYSNQDIDIKTFKTIINECSQSLENNKKKTEKIVEIYEDELTDSERDMPDLVRCKDCLHGTKTKDYKNKEVIACLDETHQPDWFCADGVKKK